MTNQIAAMLFPLLALAAAGLVALAVRKPWRRRKTVVYSPQASTRPDLQEALREVQKAIRSAERTVHNAGEKVARTLVP
jgi:hypothetical protein